MRAKKMLLAELLTKREIASILVRFWKSGRRAQRLKSLE
jgi:hypothetical protein